MANAIFFSATTGGFYHTDICGDAMPADSVRISRIRHAELLEQQSTGRRIVAGDEGQPLLAPIPRLPVEALRDRAARRIKSEAGRRILAIASATRQSNDNALLAQAALVGDRNAPGVATALARRAEIDAIRTRSDALEAKAAAMTRGALDAFDPTNDAHWS